MQLAGSSPYKVEAPRRSDRAPQGTTGLFPALSAHLIRHAMVSPYCDGVLCENTLLLPDHLIRSRGRVTTDSDTMFEFDRRLSVGKVLTGKEVTGAIHFCGAGSFNWYHFVMECLPKLLLLRRLPTEYSGFPLVLPDECRHIPSFAEALQRIAGDRKAVFLKRGESLEVDRLIVVDSISTAPFDLHDGEWPQIDDYSQHDQLILEFIHELRSSFLEDVTVESPQKRIFLVRPEGVRRDYNQRELVEIASGYGFEQVSPERLTLADQARLFANAEMVIGASGAAWVGMMFRDTHRPLKGLSWLPREYSEFCSYSTIASLLHHHLEFLDAETAKPLPSTAEAYYSSYRVSPRAFEQAVRRLASR